MIKFIDSWFAVSRSTDAIKRGTKNEVRFFEALEQLSQVVSIFEVVLLDHSRDPWFAASPDGIALMSVDGFTEPQLAMVEIKSANADAIKQQVKTVQTKYGGFFHCVLEDEVWFDAIP